MSATSLRSLERAITAVRIGVDRNGARELAACHATTLTRLLVAVRGHLAHHRKAHAFDYLGMRFRLHQFDGWVIVLTWRGQPVAGPVRIRQGDAS